MGKTIYIDVGHGGSDNGCTFADGTYEKDYNLKMAKYVYNLLKEYMKNTNIIINRTIDTSIPLMTRSNTLNKINGEVDCYSFHCNAYNKTTSGTEILLSLSNTVDKEWSASFLNQYCRKFNFKNRGIVQRRGKNGDYYHMHRETNANVKVKILELGFGDNTHDLAILKNQFTEIGYFITSSILMRYGVNIKDKPITSSDTLYRVQVGAFKDKDNAEKLVKRLKDKGFDGIIK